MEATQGLRFTALEYADDLFWYRDAMGGRLNERSDAFVELHLFSYHIPISHFRGKQNTTGPAERIERSRKLFVAIIERCYAEQPKKPPRALDISITVSVVSSRQQAG